MKILTDKDIRVIKHEAYECGWGEGKEEYAHRIEEMERALDKAKKKAKRDEQSYCNELEELQLANERHQARIAALEEERRYTTEVAKLQLKLEADELALDARAKYLDRREDNLAKLAESMKWDKAPIPQVQISSGTMPYYPDQSYQQRPY